MSNYLKVYEVGPRDGLLNESVSISTEDKKRLMKELGKRLDISKLAVHLHDTQALGLANTTAAIQAGVYIHDASIGGLGGCPFAPGTAGNLATEDLVFLAHKLGLGTGVHFPALWEVIAELERLVDRPLGGRIRARRKAKAG